ncbi:MAG: Flp pilus assembly complex ATPase component TadA [Elusimicrobia bacterium]|nr:Flp pilus assembly complex ATPase component TadA [Elusimicrobiota bacterium]
MGVRYLNTARKRLGDYLVELGFITQEQLQVALSEQRTKGGKLGTILLQMGFLSEDILLAILGKQSGVSYVSLSEYGAISDDAIKSVPEAIARTQVLVPIKKEGNLLTIAISDPLNVFATDDLKLLTGCEIRMVVASDTEIHEALERYYGAGPAPKAEAVPAAAPAPAAPAPSGPPVEFVGESFDASRDGDAVEKLVSMTLEEAVRKNASVVHVEPQNERLAVRFRVGNALENQPSPPKKIQDALIRYLKSAARLDPSSSGLAQNGLATFRAGQKNVEAALSFIPTAHGDAVAVRLRAASDAPAELGSLGFSERGLETLKRTLQARSGLVLLAGPESTSLAYAVLSSINPDVTNIMTIEDPIERMLTGVNQSQVRPEAGLTPARLLKTVSRQDPDIVFVADLCDRDTINLASEIAISGRLVIAGLAASDAPSAMSRLLEAGADATSLAAALRLVVSHRMLGRVCDGCKEVYEVPSSELVKLGAKAGVEKLVELHRGKGCAACGRMGHRGTFPIFQTLELNFDVRHVLARKGSAADLRSASMAAGAESFRRAAIDALLAGRTSMDEVTRTTGLD